MTDFCSEQQVDVKGLGEQTVIATPRSDHVGAEGRVAGRSERGNYYDDVGCSH